MAKTEQKSVEQLEQEAHDATREADHLATRMSTIDIDIEEEREAVSERRIAAAKAGQSPMAGAQRGRLDELLDERAELPELHFAARLRSAAAHVALKEKRIEELQEDAS